MKSKLSLSEKRMVLVAALGGVCSCRDSDCWHTEPCAISDSRCLQLDHVNGDGFADRKRLGGQTGVVAYYVDHLSEAREVLQVLCANCNWVKRVRNREVRGRIIHNSEIVEAVSAERLLRKRVECDIEDSPHYLELVDKYHGLLTLIIHNTSYTDLADWLESLGLDSTQQRTLSHYLAKHWLRRNPSGGTKEELANLVSLRVVDVDAITGICEGRMQREGKVRV